MLRKLTLGLLAGSAIVFAGSAMAANPWSPAQTTVPIIVTVEPMVELFTDVTPVPLSIEDAGNNQGSANAVSRVVNHLHNVNVDVSVHIDSNIPDNTQFHVLIEPAAVWLEPADANTERTVSWRREGINYIPASGGFDNQVSSPGVGGAVLAFSRAANAPATVGDPDAVVDIQYFADSRNVMPGTTGAQPSFNVVWTIQPS